MEKEVYRVWNFQPEKNWPLTNQLIQAMIPGQAMLLTSSSPLFRTKVSILFSVLVVCGLLYLLHSNRTQKIYRSLLLFIAVQCGLLVATMHYSSQPQMFMEFSAMAQTCGSLLLVVESPMINMGDKFIPVIPTIDELEEVEDGLFTIKKIHGEDANTGMCIVEWDDGEVTWEKISSVSKTGVYKAMHTTETPASDKVSTEGSIAVEVSPAVVETEVSPPLSEES